MKGMQKIKRGNNFKGVLEYAFDRQKNEEKTAGHIVGGNMAGTNAHELTREFLRFADTRLDIKKPVWHNSLRLPEGQDLTDEQWNKIGFDYMERMGFNTELNQFVFIKHDDEDGKHIHIVGSRIDMHGNVHLGRNENLISTRIISELEIEHNLTQTKNLDYIKDTQGNYAIAERSQGRGRTLSRAEEEMQNRKQWNDDIDYLAPKQRLANAIKYTLNNQPTTKEFVKRLEAENIKVMCVIKQGQMSGFSFQLDGENFKGSQVGANWKELINERKLDYDQQRDAEIIGSRKYAASKQPASSNASNTNAGKTPASKSTKESRKQRDKSFIGNLERDSSGRFTGTRESTSDMGIDHEQTGGASEPPQPGATTASQEIQLDDASRWGLADSPSIPEPLSELQGVSSPSPEPSRNNAVAKNSREPASSNVQSNESAQNPKSQMIKSLFDKDTEYGEWDADKTELFANLDHMLKTHPAAIKARKLNEVASLDINQIDDPELKQLVEAVQEYQQGEPAKYLTLQLAGVVKEFNEKQNKTPEEKELYKTIAELEDVK